ncbi:MarR family transcriptional regulator [Neobacillus mesonae]|uniref:MarR family winged helix-turn-helix transcriptional regulator n=1 Tax=Neobacillus mesonae TaxID=1193713 RepID=UPI00203D9BB0|nr:MarR family transcriptional regulator [Neobacillus mesonae]MCM3571423.1 MarR family transcriptional regulator [Neobacillus mesonae]
MEKKCTNLPYLELLKTSKAVQDRMKMELTKENLSITEFSVLEVLYFKGKQTIQQVGKKVLISSGSMTYVIDKLEKRGLLKRIACPSDRRAIHVVLTDAGNTLMDEILPKHKMLIDTIFDSLQDEEIEFFVQLLKKVRMRVKN